MYCRVKKATLETAYPPFDEGIVHHQDDGKKNFRERAAAAVVVVVVVRV